MSHDRLEVLVIGSGPGGYVAAIRAAQLGARVALVESGVLGGTCLNVGCIPTKALIASSTLLHQIQTAAEFGIEVGSVRFDYRRIKERKDQIVARIRNNLASLLRSYSIEILQGVGKLVAPHQVRVQNGEDYRLLEADRIILATGSRPKVPPLFTIDRQRVHDSSSLLEIGELPKRLAIIGGGYIGCEFASMMNQLGVEVTLIEALDRLIAQECIESSQQLHSSFEGAGIEVVTGCKVIEQKLGSSVELTLDSGRRIESDQLLICVGRELCSENLGLEAAGVYVDARGAIEVNAQMQTTLPHIYAIGDVTGRSMLAHTASHQGIVAAENACGKPTKMNYEAIPAVIFTQPEIASVGYTLDKARAAGYDAKLGKFPFQALGKAQASLESSDLKEGFAQVVIEQRSGRILGAQVVGHEAGALIAEMALAIEQELTLECLTHTVHAHPTLAEVWPEALLMAAERPLHLPIRRGPSHR